MKLLLLPAVCFLISVSVFSQSVLNQFNAERIGITKNAMIVLGSWGTANLAAGAIGLASSHGEAKYFYQMNLIWGAANLLIAAPTYFSLKHSNADEPLPETIKQQSGIEKTFLVNAALDLVYLSAGAYCLQKATNDSKKDLYNGYGKSLLLQGGGLLIFDVTMSIINIGHGKKLYKILNRFQVSGKSVSAVWKL